MRRLRKKAFFRSVTSNVIMDFRAKVEQLVHEFLETRKDLYLVDLKISAGDDITVILDGDEGLSLQDCLDASRAVEFNLDREEHDFALQVSLNFSLFRAKNGLNNIKINIKKLKWTI